MQGMQMQSVTSQYRHPRPFVPAGTSPEATLGYNTAIRHLNAAANYMPPHATHIYPATNNIPQNTVSPNEDYQSEASVGTTNRPNRSASAPLETASEDDDEMT